MPETDQNYKVVDYENHEFQAGDTFQQLYDVTFPSWMPDTGRNEVLDTLGGYGAKLESELNNSLSDGNEVTVQNTSVEQINENTHRYTVTYNVEKAQGDPITPAGIWFVIYAILIILGIVGIAWVLRETRLLLETEGGAAAMTGLLALGGYAVYSYSKSKDSSGGGSAPG